MAIPNIIDSHAHVQFPAYDEDREAVISRALDGGIWMVNIGTQELTSRDAIELAEKYPKGVYATIGFHPGHIGASHHDEWEKTAPSEEVFDIGALRALAEHTKVVGIGECGLDYYRIQDSVVRIKQEEIFRAQVGLAHELQKPLVIHCRDAFSDLIRILNSESLFLNSGGAGAVHFFSGTVEDARKLMDLGFYLGFGGVVTFAKAYERVVREIPLERIVLETDAPYVAPVPYRGKRNEPLYIEAVAEKIAEWKDVSVDGVRRITTKNAKILFRI
ncbi:MAG: hypothetical protein A3H71_01710 [Candidatus Sungbacteria bacterium RIFCSPLOWO2_02_FULL_48_13b]|uniref:Hydrolase TatD n=2 Tax=Candidatus Sungiibacteriota TaxID=1817917 RepID=A0A1G2LJ35_9BACT|nr:MAG: hypothetical protein A3C12_02380 [Candidatus Sungbacteria bacterium RIFCSPHIGHO2_02_FULL_49_20]OHA11638.1 MAG: hypothetical protein A3H71_01710 [Candidatus Sungbacteria bacterium RIFCSPLOWO2_02_FULL_48_13b]